MSDGPTAFYTERIPEQFNRALARELETDGEDGVVYRGLRAVNATIRAELTTGETWFLNIENGEMKPADAPAQEPFLTLRHELADFEALEREAGDSALGFLGGMAGLNTEIKLTKQRVDNMRRVDGCVRFTLTGDRGFSLLTHFGTGPLPEEPDCNLSIDGEIYERLQAGELDAQQAFMSGKIDILGDMQMAMQLALAVMSPD
ncbi:MAG: SCP2 sterol-binding domain-containing protein [Myxococcota bacterium]|nr:SCP2 sterol-binding domain-containing protein [Myxococcota bacterium]